MGGRAMSGNANHIFTIYWSSVIVDDFYLIRAIVRPDKADAILVIDPDTVLSLAINRLAVYRKADGSRIQSG